MATVEAHARPGLVPMLGAVLSAARPVEWLKNGFVLAPLLFSGRYDDRAALIDAALTFTAFCAVASAGYLVNDVRDRDLDRAHPVKSARPLARGTLSPSTALIAAAVLALAGLAVAAPVGIAVTGLVLGYAVLAACYSGLLKRIVIIDIMALAAFFLLRVEAGSVAIDVVPSDWLLACTASLALYLGVTKRRQELTTVQGIVGASRPVLEGYALAFVDQVVSLTATATLVSYTIYAIDAPLSGGRMLLTVPPVVYGVLRHLYLLYARNDARGIAEMATRDPGLVAAITCWVAVALVVLAGW
jgi:4-hydroxybenzoate polyprenyltransferase